MKFALCTLDNQIYEAPGFHQAPVFANSKGYLLCIECGRAASYVRQGSDGRSATYKATHVAGCRSASIVYNTQRTERVNTQLVIVIDFQQHETTVIPNDVHPHGGRYVDGSNSPHIETSTRTHISRIPLRRLLSELLGTPDFLQEQEMIRIPGRGDFSAPELLVNFSDVTPDHIGRYCGFWGEIISSDNISTQTCWFNSGGHNDVSVGVDTRHADELFSRFHLANLGTVESMHMLVFGELRHSDTKDKFIIIDDLNDMTIRIMRRI